MGQSDEGGMEFNGMAGVSVSDLLVGVDFICDK